MLAMALQVILPPHIWVPQETVRGAVPLHLHAGLDLDFGPRWTGLQITHRAYANPVIRGLYLFLLSIRSLDGSAILESTPAPERRGMKECLSSNDKSGYKQQRVLSFHWAHISLLLIIFRYLLLHHSEA